MKEGIAKEQQRSVGSSVLGESGLLDPCPSDSLLLSSPLRSINSDSAQCQVSACDYVKLVTRYGDAQWKRVVRCLL